jgi:hypothetical protein
MLDQLVEGLKMFGVLELIKKHENQMKCVFTPVTNSCITVGQIIDLMSPSYSDSRQMKDKEINTYKAMCDFVEELYHNGEYWSY